MEFFNKLFASIELIDVEQGLHFYYFFFVLHFIFLETAFTIHSKSLSITLPLSPLASKFAAEHFSSPHIIHHVGYLDNDALDRDATKPHVWCILTVAQLQSTSEVQEYKKTFGKAIESEFLLQNCKTSIKIQKYAPTKKPINLVHNGNRLLFPVYEVMVATVAVPNSDRSYVVLYQFTQQHMSNCIEKLYESLRSIKIHDPVPYFESQILQKYSYPEYNGMLNKFNIINCD